MWIHSDSEMCADGENVLHYCTDEEGKHFGGKTLIGSKQSWYVDISGAKTEGAAGILGSNASTGSVDIA